MWMIKKNHEFTCRHSYTHEDTHTDAGLIVGQWKQVGGSMGASRRAVGASNRLVGAQYKDMHMKI